MKNFGVIAEKIEKSKSVVIKEIALWEENTKEDLSNSQKILTTTIVNEKERLINNINQQGKELRNELKREKENTLNNVKLYERKGHLYSLLNLILLIILIAVTSFTLYQYQGSEWVIPETYQVEQNGTLFVLIPKEDLSETKDEKSVYFILKEKN